jgi:hypothetical protein
MDEAFNERYSGFDFGRNGCFFDDTGEQIAMFGVVEIERFIAALDGAFQSPFGRKLIYAATDAEELVLRGQEQFRPGRWFGKKKVVAALQHRSLAMGWGIFDEHTIVSPCHDGLCVGFALAHREHLTSTRWNIHWHQSSHERIDISFKPNQHTVNTPPKKQIQLWGGEEEPSFVSEQFALDLDLRGFGFFNHEERCFFLPISVFTTFFSSLIGRPLTSDSIQPSEGLFEGLDHAELFRAVMFASRMTFLKHEFPVYVQTASDWSDLLEQRLTLRGFGRVICERCVVEEHDETVFIVDSSLPAYVCGILLGMWERAFGSRSTFHVQKTDLGLNFRVSQPKVDYE